MRMVRWLLAAMPLALTAPCPAHAGGVEGVLDEVLLRQKQPYAVALKVGKARKVLVLDADAACFLADPPKVFEGDALGRGLALLQHRPAWALLSGGGRVTGVYDEPNWRYANPPTAHRERGERFLPCRGEVVAVEGQPLRVNVPLPEGGPPVTLGVDATVVPCLDRESRFCQRQALRNGQAVSLAVVERLRPLLLGIAGKVCTDAAAAGPLPDAWRLRDDWAKTRQELESLPDAALRITGDGILVRGATPLLGSTAGSPAAPVAPASTSPLPVRVIYAGESRQPVMAIGLRQSGRRAARRAPVARIAPRKERGGASRDELQGIDPLPREVDAEDTLSLLTASYSRPVQGKVVEVSADPEGGLRVTLAGNPTAIRLCPWVRLEVEGSLRPLAELTPDDLRGKTLQCAVIRVEQPHYDLWRLHF